MPHRPALARVLAVACGLALAATVAGTHAAWSTATPATTVRVTAAPRLLLYPLPAAPVQPEPCPPPPTPPGPPAPPLGPPEVREDAIPLVGAPPPRHVDLSAISGKGIWLTLWPGSPLNVNQLIATAHVAGLRQLWVRTGSSSPDGFYGATTLKALLPAAHAAGIAVIAWDFPALSNPADRRDAGGGAHSGPGPTGSPPTSSPPPKGHTSPRGGSSTTSRAFARQRATSRSSPSSRGRLATGWLPTRTQPRRRSWMSSLLWSTGPAPSPVQRSARRSRPWPACVRLRRSARTTTWRLRAADTGCPRPVRSGASSMSPIRAGAIGASLYDLEAGGHPQLAALGGYPW